MVRPSGKPCRQPVAQVTAPAGRGTTPPEGNPHSEADRDLNYHVLAGKVAAADVVKLDGKTAKTLNGGDLKVSTKSGVKLNGEVNVTKTDIAASNGLIHVVDPVLLPSA